MSIYKVTLAKQKDSRIKLIRVVVADTDMEAKEKVKKMVKWDNEKVLYRIENLGEMRGGEYGSY